MCIRDSRKAAFGGALVVFGTGGPGVVGDFMVVPHGNHGGGCMQRLQVGIGLVPVSYTHLRAHETVLDLVCRLLLEKKTKSQHTNITQLATVEPTHCIIADTHRTL